MLLPLASVKLFIPSFRFSNLYLMTNVLFYKFISDITIRNILFQIIFNKITLLLPIHAFHKDKLRFFFQFLTPDNRRQRQLAVQCFATGLGTVCFSHMKCFLSPDGCPNILPQLTTELLLRKFSVCV